MKTRGDRRAGDPLRPRPFEPATPRAHLTATATVPIDDELLARRAVERVAEDPLGMRALRDLCHEAPNLGADPELTDADVLDLVSREIAAGRLHLRAEQARLEHRTRAEPGEAAAEEREPQAPDEGPPWVRFVFEYPDRSAAGGFGYLLVDPNGQETEGTLGADGTVEVQNCERGTYRLELKTVRRIRWLKPRVKCVEPGKILAETTGYKDGTTGKLHFYRELREAEAERLDTIEVTIHGGQIETEWTYDYARDEARQAEMGIATFIAELELDGGDVWAKTPRPLQVELKTILEAKWGAGEVTAGEPVALEVQTLGYPDGTQLKAELWEDVLLGPDEKAKDLDPLTVNGGRGNLTWTAEIPGDDSVTDGAAPQRIEPSLYAIVKIDDDCPREKRSPRLVCRRP